MPLTKPCPRIGQPGCIGVITDLRARLLARRQYCCLRCSAFARIAQGIRAPTRSHEEYVRLGAMGGRAAGVNKRKRAALKAADHIKRLIPASMRLRLSAADYAWCVAALARAWRMGHTTGRARLQHVVNRQQQKGAA